MTSLVSTANEVSGSRLWFRRLAIALMMFGFVGLVAWAGLNLSHGPTKTARQVAKIALLPDNPPPPPPPPPDRPKLEPRNEIKQQIQRPKMETPPEPQQLKMEGAAGEGPSPFAAGDVKNDYIGGDIGNGAAMAAYVGRVADFIQAQIAKRNLKVGNAKLYLWLRLDGSVQRFEIDGNKVDQEQMRLVMADISRLPEAPRQDMHFGLEVSGR